MNIKIFTAVFLGGFLMLNSLLKSETETSLLSQAINSSAKEGWEYSANGGYIFEAKMDLVGNDEPEKLIWFSLDGSRSVHVFKSSPTQEYLGKLNRDLFSSPMVREDKKNNDI